LNKTKIEWTDYTWNPITGCKNGCWYCYARKIYKRFGMSFEPTFHPERLLEPLKLKQPAKIFVCSVSDFFAKWTKQEWRDAVINVVKQCPQHIFQFLTKQPQCINLKPMKNVWVGATITRDSEMEKLYHLVNNYDGLKFISFEPLLEPVYINQTDGYFEKIDWVIVGALTGYKGYAPEKEWVQYIIRECKAREIPIFLKDNLHWAEKIQEFPKTKRECD